MDGAWWPIGRWGVAFFLASYIGVSGLKKNSLDKSGAIAVRQQRILYEMFSIPGIQHVLLMRPVEEYCLLYSSLQLLNTQ